MDIMKVLENLPLPICMLIGATLGAIVRVLIDFYRYK